MKYTKIGKKTGKWGIGLVPVLVAGLFAALATPAYAIHGWAVGDLFTAISNGQYQQFDAATDLPNDLIQTFPTGHMTNGIFDGGYTVGCALNPAATPTSAVNLYTTNFIDRKIVIMSDTNNTTPVGSFTLAGTTGNPETIVFNAVGDYYVSLVDADANQPNLLKYSGTTNTLMASYNLTTVDERHGVTGFDLSSDQTTIYYTSPGTHVFKATLPATGTNVTVAGTIFASGFSRAYGVRVLQQQNSFGPSATAGFLMVADTTAIKVLSAAGAVVNSYDATISTNVNNPPTDHNGWFTISVAAGGNAFWAADFYTGDVVRFNASGSIAKQFNANPDPFRVNGLCVKGEVTSGGTPFPNGGFFVIGDGPNHGYPAFTNVPPNGANVYFWGPQWGQSSKNTFSLGNTGDNAFKGFAENTSAPSPTCGDTFTSKGGQSNPPATVPGIVAVLITTQVTTPPVGKATGVIKAIVLVQVDPGYDGSVGGGGTGKIIKVVCVKP